MSTPATTRRRLRMQVTGAVQGVGFRPFLYRTATELGLSGWIRNDTRGVMLEAEGAEPALRALRDRVRSEPPPRAVIHEVREEWLPALGLEELTILPSEAVGDRVASVLPDLATCDACLQDIGLRPAAVELSAGEPSAGEPSDGMGPRIGSDQSPVDRRHGYAFTNCTDCGPRFSIIRALPYDRPNTTMEAFALCPACRTEYEDPLDRRFHAQPTACPACGPRLWLEPADGTRREVAGSEVKGEASGEATGEVADEAAGAVVAGDVSAADPVGADSLAAAASAIRDGEILAVKGLGGFHLVVDAGDEGAVRRLRARKRRPTKPLAVMVRDLEQARVLCRVPPEAEALLVQPEAPIVLLERRADAPVADGVAPGNPYLGVMLPYTPLHHLLLRAVGRPVVATSGNLTDEPICTRNDDARRRLGGIADRFLLHDRPIQRPVDDSVVQLSAGLPRLLRRSRGYAPLPIRLDSETEPTLAVGGHLKNTVALSRGRDVFLSQHIGDLETPQALEAFEAVIADFLRLYDVEPARIAHDLHPDYASTLWAARAARGSADRTRAAIPTVAVQHHHAHLASCLIENGEDRALGVVWDGTGLGTDGTVWGGEFLLGGAGHYERVAHLRRFRLPGGDAAVKEPRRMALALAHAAWGDDGVERVLERLGPDTFGAAEVDVLRQVLDRGFRAPWTTSAGRLFDGVASLLGLHHRVVFEGEAAMALEYAVAAAEAGAYGFPVSPSEDGSADGADGGAVEGTFAGSRPAIEGRGGNATSVTPRLVVDWEPALGELLEDVDGGTTAPVAAARFHNGLVRAIRQVAEAVGEPNVALTGGVFQNRILTERTEAALREAGMKPLLHRRIPANDGGLSLGQVAVAAAQQGEANQD